MTIIRENGLLYKNKTKLKKNQNRATWSSQYKHETKYRKVLSKVEIGLNIMKNYAVEKMKWLVFFMNVSGF